MASPTDLVKPVLGCLGVNVSLSLPSLSVAGPTIPGLTIPPINIPSLEYAFAWPSIDLPGLPTIMCGFFGSLLAGIEFALGFLPPDPHHLPQIPTIDFFIQPFTAAAIGLPKLPPINLQIPGLPQIPFPGMPGIVIPGFDPSAMLNLIGMFIGIPFLLIKGVIEGILNLQIKIPTFDVILNLLIGLGLAVGFPSLTMAFIMPCLAKTAVNAFSALG